MLIISSLPGACRADVPAHESVDFGGKKKDLRYGILRDRFFFCHDRDLHSGSLVSLVFLVMDDLWLYCCTV